MTRCISGPTFTGVRMRHGAVTENGLRRLRLVGPEGDPHSQKCWNALDPGVQGARRVLRALAQAQHRHDGSLSTKARKLAHLLVGACNRTPLAVMWAPISNHSYTIESIPVIKSRLYFLETTLDRLERPLSETDGAALYREYVLQQYPRDLSELYEVTKALAEIYEATDFERLSRVPTNVGWDDLQRERDHLAAALRNVSTPLRDYAKIVARQRTMQRLGGMQPKKT